MRTFLVLGAVLLAATTPGPGVALAEVAAGTSLAGFTIRTLAFCQ